VGGSYLGFTQWLLAKEHPAALRAIAPVVTTSDYYHTPFRHQGGVFELGCALFWSLFMVPEELQRQLRQGKASMEQMGALMQVMSNPSSQFEHLPLVDMSLLRDFAPYYLDLEGPADTIAFEIYIEQILALSLQAGHIVVMDNLSCHTGEKVRQALLARGCQLLFLPSYSPDLSPIEEAFSKLKAFLRRVGARTPETLQEALGQALLTITAQDALGWFRHCGYCPDPPLSSPVGGSCR
jgi:transposase